MSTADVNSSATPSPAGEPELHRLFRAAVKLKGSDLHLKVERPPFVRVNGVLRPLNRGPIEAAEMERICLSLLTPRLQEQLETVGGVDLGYSITIDNRNWRFRINIFRQRGLLGLIARAVPPWVLDFEKLHLPQALENLCHHVQGLVLLAGDTGTGKTTTIAAMLDYINHRYAKHILTLEDPIEYGHTDDKCVINQREIGLDVVNFDIGIRQALREDPDVMLIGEIRDRDSFTAAAQAAETGHLVFATIHASSAAAAISRILDLHPPEIHAAVRRATAFHVRGVVAQRLVRSIKPGVPFVPMVEIMFITPTIQRLILDGHDVKLADALRLGASDGMQDYTASLKALVDQQLIDRQAAIEAAPRPEELRSALRGIEISSGGILQI
jgi:twitching motility protein PilT